MQFFTAIRTTSKIALCLTHNEGRTARTEGTVDTEWPSRNQIVLLLVPE